MEMLAAPAANGCGVLPLSVVATCGTVEPSFRVNACGAASNKMSVVVRVHVVFVTEKYMGAVAPGNTFVDEVPLSESWYSGSAIVDEAE